MKTWNAPMNSATPRHLMDCARVRCRRRFAGAVATTAMGWLALGASLDAQSPALPAQVGPRTEPVVAPANGGEKDPSDTAAVPASANPAVAIQAPAKKVMLVFREDLKRGVAVAMLKAVMAEKRLGGKTPEKITLEDFNIQVGLAGPAEKTVLLLTDKPAKDYYCWTKIADPAAPIYYIDGCFALNRKDVMSVRFSSANHETWLVIDEKPGEPIFTGLKFQFDLSGPAPRLTGALADWIKRVEPADKDLRLVMNRTIPLTTVSIPNATTGPLPNCPMASYAEKIFPLLMVESYREKPPQKLLEEMRTKMAAYLELALSRRTDKMTKELNSECNALMRAMVETLGKTFAAKITHQPATTPSSNSSPTTSRFNEFSRRTSSGLSTSDPITKETRDAVVAGLAKLLNLDLAKIQPISSEYERALIQQANTEQELKDLNAKIASIHGYDDRSYGKRTRLKALQESIEKNLKDNPDYPNKRFYAAIGKCILTHRKPFGLSDFDRYQKMLESSQPIENSDMPAAIEFCSKLLQRSAEPSSLIDQQRKTYLGNIESLRVLTQQGRILFEATNATPE